MSGPTFTFDDYLVRPVGERDRAFIEQRIAADQYHAGMTADYYLHLVPGEDAWAIENQQGVVLLYFKTKVACRLALLFGNQSSNENRDVLTKGVEWLVGELSRNRFRELIFDSEAPVLQVMARKRLGFAEVQRVQVRHLPIPEADKNMAVLWNTVPQASQDEGKVTHVRT